VRAGQCLDDLSGRRRLERPALEEAVDAKLEEQRRFVAWWKGAVRRTGPANKLNRDRGLILADAEALTGMTQQRVSDLGDALGQRSARAGRSAAWWRPAIRGLPGKGCGPDQA
jgi:hypothetical protein